MSKFIKLSLLVALFNFIFYSSAYAYLDPGTFNIILQSIIAFIAAVGATYRLWLFRIKNFFKKIKKNFLTYSKKQ